jgi:hypothetical protein
VQKQTAIILTFANIESSPKLSWQDYRRNAAIMILLPAGLQSFPENNSGGDADLPSLA